MDGLENILHSFEALSLSKQKTSSRKVIELLLYIVL